MIAIAVLIRGVDLFRIYDYVYVMTDGGPGTATETLTSYAGRIYFNGDFPYAATSSLITLIVLIVVSNLSCGCSRCASDGAEPRFSSCFATSRRCWWWRSSCSRWPGGH